MPAYGGDGVPDHKRAILLRVRIRLDRRRDDEEIDGRGWLNLG